ncbi:WYL domain-containing protein [Roseateles sp. GG27B]
MELRASFKGELRRGDIESRFGIKPAAASRDLSLYREVAPDNQDYDQASRCYRPSASFKPVCEFHHERVLARLLQGFGNGLDLGLRQAAPCEGLGQLVKPDRAVLSTIIRSMCAMRAVRVKYLSLTSGDKKRKIVPVALADNCLRWHVRSYDRERKRFSDFVLKRIAKAQEIDDQVAKQELLSADEQCAQTVMKKIVAQPGIRFPQAVEADNGMDDGVLRLKALAALAGYVLRRWLIDASDDHSLDLGSHHLWLSNPQTLLGVESAALAPGRGQGRETNKSQRKA